MLVHDINRYLGRSMRSKPGECALAPDLLASMGQSGISKALVWHVAQHDCSPVLANEMLSSAIAGQERLYGCWSILPPQTHEIASHGFFENMAANNIRALRAMPLVHGYQLRRAVFGDFFDELAERCIPLLLSLERGMTWPLLYDFLADYPETTVVICDTGIWGQDRQFWPLLENYPRVFVETSLVSLEAGGLEAGVRRFGCDRFIFGSGFPLRYPEAPLLDLLHADLTVREKEHIAHLNMENLMNGVRL